MAKNTEIDTAIGEGGETHQRVPEQGPHNKADSHLTTNQGIRVSDNQNSLRAGARGPTLLEDFVLREKIFHFDDERIPERIVHARGSAAHGYFQPYESLADITSADLFQRKGERSRFSRVSRPWRAAPARWIPHATCAALPSSFTPSKAIGTWSETTFRFFSSRMR